MTNSGNKRGTGRGHSASIQAMEKQKQQQASSIVSERAVKDAAPLSQPSRRRCFQRKERTPPGAADCCDLLRERIESSCLCVSAAEGTRGIFFIVVNQRPRHHRAACSSRRENGMRSSLPYSHRLARSTLTQGWLATTRGNACLRAAAQGYSVASNVRRNGRPGSPLSLCLHIHIRRLHLRERAAPRNASGK